MRTRPILTLGLSAALLSLTFVGPAHAQRGNNAGRQVERQLLNNLGNQITGQPNYPNQPYPGQPYPYQGGLGGYGQPGYPQQGGLGNLLLGPGTQQPYAPGTYPQQPQQGFYQQQPQQGFYQQQAQQGFYQQQPVGAGVRYQLPPQYAAATPGTVVNYSGANYVVNADRTMSPTTAPATGAAPGQPGANAPRYQIPPQFAAAAPGTVVSYGVNYVINADHTMSPVR